METWVPKLALGVINGSQAPKWELGYQASSWMWICVSTRAAPNVLTLGTLRFLTWIGSSFDLASGYFDPILQHFFAL